MIDKFHQEEVIGRSKHSKVWRARERKTICFYALKRVDCRSQSQRSRVEQEVTALRALNHANIVKFREWCQSSRHYWLVLEFCVGGSLFELLKQDRRLPEPVVRDFGVGLAAALQYCHSKSLIYSDMKPSNLLLDENGCIKLGGFGLSRNLHDINTAPPSQQPPAGTGSPYYMAPELFQPGAVHSFASDLWALGVVLYECFAGAPPFRRELLADLQRDIETAEPPPLKGASAEFADLVSQLLGKHPATRIGWPQLRAHPFWQRGSAVGKCPLPELRLPRETAFEAYLTCSQTCVASHGLTSQGGRGSGDAKQHALRLSLAVRRNLEAEVAAAVTDYTGVSAGAGAADVRLHTPDAELDFDERASETGGSESGDEPNASAAVDNSAAEGAQGAAERSQLAALADGSLRVSFAALSPPQAAVRPLAGQQMAQQAAQQPPAHPLTPQATPQRQQQQQLRRQQQPQADAAAAGAAQSPTAFAAAWAGVTMATTPVQPVPTDPGQPARAEALIWHSSDMAAQPIVGNAKIERLAQPRFNERMLPVPAWEAAQLLAAPEPDQDAFIAAIIHTLAAAAPIKDKTNVLAFVEARLCCNVRMANNFLNSEDIAGLLVRMLRGASASSGSSREKDSLKAHLAGVLGLLLRHATEVNEGLASTGILEVLMLAAGDKAEKVRRRATAALGELLFYIATQGPAPEAFAPYALLEQPGNCQQAAPMPQGGWHVPPAAVNLLTHLMKPGEDEITQHYAVRTVENVSTADATWAARFADPALVANLVSLWSGARNDSVRGAAACAAARLLRHAPQQLVVLVSKFGARILVSGLGDPLAKVQLASANMLAQALSAPDPTAFRTRGSLQGGLPDQPGALQDALALLDSPHPLARAKALLLIALLVRGSPAALADACSGGLLAAADKLVREGDQYVLDAIVALNVEIAAVVPTILKQLLDAVHGHALQRAAAWDEGGAAQTFTMTMPPLLASTALSGAAASPQLVESLAAALQATAGAEDDVTDQIKSQVLAAVEAFVSGGVDSVAPFAHSVSVCLVPALAAAAAGPFANNTRFETLRLLLDVLFVFAAMPADPEGGGRSWVAELEAVVTAQLLPAVPQLFELDSPLPLFTLKLLAGLVEERPCWAPVLARTGLLPQFVDFLHVAHANNNVHNLRIMKALLQAGAVPPHQIEETDAAEKVAAVLDYTVTNQVATFMEPVLELCAVLLAAYAPSFNGRPSRFGAAAAKGAAAVSAGLLPMLPRFLDVAGCEEPGPAALAAQCVAALARLSPVDASGLLLDREGASQLAASLAGGPAGVAGNPARHFLLDCIVAAATAARRAGTAQPDAVKQLQRAVARLLPADVGAHAAEAAAALAALRRTRLPGLPGSG